MALLVAATAAASLAAGTMVGMGRLRWRRQQELLQAVLETDPVLLADMAAIRIAEEMMPVWALFVHVERAELVPRLSDVRLQVRVKYGEPGRSLHHWTSPATGVMQDDGRTFADFEDSCVFPWRPDLQPVLRLRLARLGLVNRVISKVEFTLPFHPGTAGRRVQQLHVQDTCLYSKWPFVQLLGQIRVRMELRCVPRHTLYGQRGGDELLMAGPAPDLVIPGAFLNSQMALNAPPVRGAGGVAEQVQQAHRAGSQHTVTGRVVQTDELLSPSRDNALPVILGTSLRNSSGAASTRSVVTGVKVAD